MNLVRLRKAIEAIDAATHTDDALFALEELVAAAREICADPDVRLVRFTTSVRPPIVIVDDDEVTP